jgi:hypothetical protein
MTEIEPQDVAPQGDEAEAPELRTSPIETALFALLVEAGAGKSVSPEAVARAVDAEGWRRILAQVRATAVGLARQGKVVITRHGKPADPNTFKGVYRLKAPL